MKAKHSATSTPPGISLPTGYGPKPVKHFDVKRIILAKGSLGTAQREAFVRGICDVYSHVPVEEHLDTPHSKIRFDEDDPLLRQREGKRALLLGELGKAVLRHKKRWRSDPPDYWCFSTYGHCPYGCKYCYLAGAKTVWYSPSVKIYVNLPEIIARINAIANRAGVVTGFHMGRFQDGLAMDPLSGYSTVLVPFFAGHENARQLLLTKSDDVERLLRLEHGGNTTLAWSLNPPRIASVYEENTPAVEARMRAMGRCAQNGYPVRASIEPIIPHGHWERSYSDFVCGLLSRVRLQRLHLGRLYVCPGAAYLTKRRMGKEDAISRCLANRRRIDARQRYTVDYYDRVVQRIALAAKKVQPDLEIGYCSLL